MRAIRLIPWAGLLLLCSCAPLGGTRSEAPTLHTLEHTHAGLVFSPQGPRLRVSMTRAAPGLDSARMFYQRRPHERAAYSRSRWLEPPARLIGPLLVQALESSGHFSAILSGSEAAEADLRLDSELLQLHQDFTRTPSVLVLQMRVQLFALDSRALLGSRVIEAEEPAGEDAYAGVLAANRAASRVLDEVMRFSAEIAGQRSGRP